MALAFGLLRIVYVSRIIRREFRATDRPSVAEAAMARIVRNWGILASARDQKNPWPPTADVLQEARDDFTNHCAPCHGKDGDGRTVIGQNLYPKAPDLRRPETQSLTDGEIHWIIQNGVRLTGMPAFGNPMIDDGEIPHDTEVLRQMQTAVSH
jgi:mono/diheme cytochrome c family protein